VSHLPHKDEGIRQSARAGLAALLAGIHGSGDVATEAVQLIADLVRRHKCIVPPSTLDCLLGLQFPDVQSSTETTDGRGRPHKKKRQKREHDAVDRSFLEAQAAADLASRQANQTATLEALFEMMFRQVSEVCECTTVVTPPRKLRQSMIKCRRVLKTCSASGLLQLEAAPLSRQRFQERFPLLFPALRLLSKFVHLVRWGLRSL
jgi:nucleolar complex protein 3